VITRNAIREGRGVALSVHGATPCQRGPALFVQRGLALSRNDLGTHGCETVHHETHKASVFHLFAPVLLAAKSCRLLLKRVSTAGVSSKANRPALVAEDDGA
jgi:hypothetical protein